MRDVDAIVVGAGVMGGATAWWLARSGRTVALLEQFEVGHGRGSSHGPSRVFRFSYDDPVFVGMAMEAQGRWREAEAEAGATLLIPLGGIDVGEGIEANAAALAASDAPHELVDGAEAMRRYPRISLEPGDPALLQPDAGVVLASRAVRTFVDLAVARGAELHEGSPVTELSAGDGSVSVRVGDETLTAPVAVVTAGAWVRPLAATAGIEVPVAPSRETVAYFPMPEEFDAPILVEWGGLPFYGLPDPGQGIKGGGHQAGPPADPDQPGEVDPDRVAAIADWVRLRYPHADPLPSRAETCFYTNTDDERFILERHGPVVIGSACSGHGFKFAPLIGKRLADLALT